MTWRRPACAVALAGLAVHLAANPHYGFFRDELYFIVCGRHPDFGYADQPPLAPLLAALTQVLGPSLFLLRALPAFCAAGTAWAGGLLAAELGGGAFAEGFAALLCLLPPLLAAFGVLVGPDGLQIPLSVAATLCVARALRRDARWMLPAGLALGLATEAKYTAFLFGLSLAVGLLAGGQWRLALRRETLAGAALAALEAAPSLVWQALHGWPMIALLQHGQQGKNVMLSPAAFLGQQLVLMHPLLAPFWVGGLLWALWSRQARWLGIAAATLIAAVMLLHGKAYYAVVAYPLLLSAGGVATEKLIGKRAWARPALAGGAILVALPLMPLFTPVLPEPLFARYFHGLQQIGLAPAPMEHHRPTPLGQIFADMHGWPEMAHQVAAMRANLPPALRDRARVFTSNYGEAAAISFFTPEERPPLSAHNQYWFWGPGDWDGSALLDVNGDEADDARLCAHAETIGHLRMEWGMPFEDGAPVILCTGLRESVASLWPRLKRLE